jgi:hypothetical protein
VDRQALALEDNRLDMGVRQGPGTTAAPQSTPGKILFARVPQIKQDTEGHNAQENYRSVLLVLAGRQDHGCLL